MFQETAPPNSPPAPATNSTYGQILLISLHLELFFLAHWPENRRTTFVTWFRWIQVTLQLFLVVSRLGWFRCWRFFLAWWEKYGVLSFCEVGDDFFCSAFSGNFTRNFWEGCRYVFLHQPEIQSPSIFLGNFLGAPEKKKSSHDVTLATHKTCFSLPFLGGVGTMFTSFCWENVWNIQHATFQTLELYIAFFVRTTMAIGELFLCIFCCLLEFLRSKGFIVKQFLLFIFWMVK